MTIFCPHGFCYAGFILPKAESRDHLFSFMVKYLEKLPKYLVYDFGCAALDLLPQPPSRLVSSYGGSGGPDALG